MKRRTFLAGAVAAAAVRPLGAAMMEGARPMYGLIGTMTVNPGKRAELASILLEGVGDMPGCLSYIVADDPANDDILWITEVWESKDAHAASLSLPSVREAITRARPLIAGMKHISETTPLGGHGLRRL